jgi:hypothetical protein
MLSANTEILIACYSCAESAPLLMEFAVDAVVSSFGQCI